MRGVDWNFATAKEALEELVEMIGSDEVAYILDGIVEKEIENRDIASDSLQSMKETN